MNEDSIIVEFEGRLEDCVLLVKHPLNETIHPWYAYGKFKQWIDRRGEAPLCGKDGQEIGRTSALISYVSNVFENLLWYEGDCLLMGVTDVNNYTVQPPVELFQTITTMDNLE
mgnify:CR=1 FL=1|jgi:hypothetical protein